MTLSPKKLRAFVPSGSDYATQLRFYSDLGFELTWSTEQLAIFRVGEFEFFLQNFENRVMQDNFMMDIQVDNVDDWWTHIGETGIAEKYNVRLKAPQDYPWGLREIHLIDPAGVLWHISQRLEKAT